MDRGVVYITFIKNKKADRIAELRHSVKSIKRFHPDLPITLFTDNDPKVKGIDKVEIVSIDSERVKQVYLPDTPYQKTLYLDCDTEIVKPINEMFDLLDRFELAATYDLIRKDPKKSKVYPDYAKIPDGFPEYAGGVILYKKCNETDMFFEAWRKNYNNWYELTGQVRDQPSFRVSIWQCTFLKFHTLPSEYNIRTKNYNNIIPRINHTHSLWKEVNK